MKGIIVITTAFITAIKAKRNLESIRRRYPMSTNFSWLMANDLTNTIDVLIFSNSESQNTNLNPIGS